MTTTMTVTPEIIMAAMCIAMVAQFIHIQRLRDEVDRLKPYQSLAQILDNMKHTD